MLGIASKKDFFLVSIIGVLFGLLAIPILENIKIPGWELTFKTTIFLAGGFFLFANFALAVAGLIGKKLPGVFQFAKYAATGSLNAFTDLGILNFLSLAFQIFSGPFLVIFNTISFGTAVTNSYFWNRYWAFKKDGVKATAKEFFMFVVVTFSGIIINSVILYLLTTTYGAPPSISVELWENIAKSVAAPISILWNFIGYKFFVFK